MFMCAFLPLAMRSNLWPIAIPFWALFTVPPALALGALIGWILRKQQVNNPNGVFLMTGLLMAIVTGVVMFVLD